MKRSNDDPADGAGDPTAADQEATVNGDSPSSAGAGAAFELPSAAVEIPGRYREICEYARGGIGRVLLVRDQHLDRDVALKELVGAGLSDTPTLEAGESPEADAVTAARFLQEARITGQLEHPSIVPLYEVGRRQDGTLYYTMKFVRGRTFKQAIAPRYHTGRDPVICLLTQRTIKHARFVQRQHRRKTRLIRAQVVLRSAPGQLAQCVVWVSFLVIFA